MRLKNFNHLASLIIFFIFSSLFAEEKIDIWKNKKETIKDTQDSLLKKIDQNNTSITSQTIKTFDKIEIKEGDEIKSEEKNVFGIVIFYIYPKNSNLFLRV